MGNVLTGKLGPGLSRCWRIDLEASCYLGAAACTLMRFRTPKFHRAPGPQHEAQGMQFGPDMSGQTGLSVPTARPGPYKTSHYEIHVVSRKSAQTHSAGF